MNLSNFLTINGGGECLKFGKGNEINVKYQPFFFPMCEEFWSSENRDVSMFVFQDQR